MKSETIYFQLTLAAPLHIGCGEVYEPMGFVVDQENNELICFNPADFLEQLTSEELEKFSAVCRRGTIDSIQDLYKFMRRHREFAKGFRIGVSDDFAHHYDEVLNKSRQHFGKELNQFAVNRTAFNPIENAPIIPGSSIKGAIRTAVLNARNKATPQPKKDFSRVPLKQLGRETARESGQLQRNLFGGTFDTDPFRLVKVADFVPIGEVKRKISYAVDVKKKPSDKQPSALFQMQETIEPGSSFLGSITVLPAPRNIKKPVTMDEITEAMGQFFGDEKQREDLQLQGINVRPAKFNGGTNIPLRIGRHSGAECITVNGHRHIKISPPPVKPPKFSKHGATTIWLASNNRKPSNNTGLQPMGWVELCRLSKEELTALRREREQILAEQHKQREKELVELADQEEIRLQKVKEAEELRRQQEQEIADEQARKEAMQQKWQAMSEEEQYLAIVRGDDLAVKFATDKDPLRDIWPKLDEVQGEYKKKIATAFKERWQMENKWAKKNCSKKQFKKVQRVKEILDEV